MAEECLRNCPHKIDGSKVDTRKAIPREEIVSEYRDGYRWELSTGLFQNEKI